MVEEDGAAAGAFLRGMTTDWGSGCVPGKTPDLRGVSGYEDEVRQPHTGKGGRRADRVEVDRLGSVIVWEDGRKHPDRVVMVDAHMDEVGFIGPASRTTACCASRGGRHGPPGAAGKPGADPAGTGCPA